MLHFPGFTPFEISDILLVCLGGQKLFIPKEGHSPMSTLFLRARTVRSVFSQGCAVGEYVRPSGGRVTPLPLGQDNPLLENVASLHNITHTSPDKRRLARRVRCQVSLSIEVSSSLSIANITRLTAPVSSGH